MNGPYALALWPWPFPGEVLELVKRAKAELALDYTVVPMQAAPGGSSRVLSVAGLPPFVCDAAVIDGEISYLKVRNALEWVLTAPPEDDRGWMKKDYLELLLGPGVREVTEEYV